MIFDLWFPHHSEVMLVHYSHPVIDYAKSLSFFTGLNSQAHDLL